MAIALNNLVLAAFIAVSGLAENAGAMQRPAAAWDPVQQITQEADELFALASGHYEREEWQQAIDKFQVFARSSPHHPQSPAAWFFTGEAFLQTGDLAQARSAYQHFQILNSRKDLSEKAAFRVAEIAARTSDPQAVRFLEEFLQLYPQSPWREFGLYYLGHLRLIRNEPQLARQVLETALTEIPQSRMRHENLLGAGIACRATGDLDDAQGHLDQLVSESTGTMRYGGMLQLAGIHLLKNEFEQALALIDGLIAADDLPDSLSGETWLLAGACHAKSEDDETAIECFQFAIDSSNDDDLTAQATWQLATAHRRMGKTGEANSAFASLIKSWPKHRLAVHALISLLESSYEQEKWEDSVDYADAALSSKLPPENVVRIRELKGRSHYELKNYAECETTFEGLLTEYPQANTRNRTIWLYFAGSSQIGQEEFGAGVETLKQIKLDGLESEVSDNCHMALATAYLGAGQFGQAAATFRTAVKNSANAELKQRARHEMLLALARESSLAEIGRELDDWWESEEGSARCIGLTRRIAQEAVTSNEDLLAEKCFEFLVTSPGSNAETRAESLSAMGWMALDKGDPEKALEYFEQLTGDYPESPLCADCWIAMASIHEQREAWETASWMYGHAADFSPKPASRHAAMFKQAVMLRKIGTDWAVTRGGNILKELAGIEGHEIPNEQLQYELAWFDQHSGHPDASLARFEMIANSPTDSPVWADSALRVAQRHLQAGNHSSARPMLTKLVTNTRTPDAIMARSHFLLGQIASASGDWKQAETEIGQALGNSDDDDFDLRCQYWFAECQYRNGKFDSAATSFARLSELESRFDDSIIPWIWLRLGQCQAQMNDWHAVSETVGESVGRFSTFASNWEFDFLAGRERFAAGMFDDAIVQLVRVTAAPTARGSETAAQAQWLIGEAYFHQEKYKDAIEAYYKVDSLYRSPQWRPAAMVQAGKCQEHLGNHSQAIALYSQLIKKFPECQYVAQANRRLEQLKSQNQSAVARTAVRRKTNPIQAKPAQTIRSNTDARKRP